MEEYFLPEGEKPVGIKEKVIKYTIRNSLGYKTGVVKNKETPIVQENSEASTKSFASIFGILFIIWFVASIALMIYFSGSKETQDLVITMVGQYFFVFGVIALVSKHMIGLVFTLVGGIMMAASLCYRFYGNEIMTEIILIKLICFVFILIGILLAIYAFNASILKKRRCTLEVSTRCTYINQEKVYISSDRAKAFQNMWVSYFRYYHNGKYYYSSCEAISATRPKPHLNASKNIFINPNNPEEYWDDSCGGPAVALIATSIFSILIGLFAFLTIS